MKKLTISNAALVHAVKKASVSVRDTFVLSVLAKDVGNGARQGSLSCCDGNTQSNIYIPVVADDDACGEYVFGKEFGQIVQTLSAYDEKDFVIRQKGDGTCTISCGGAVVPIPVRDSATKIQPKNLKECGAVVIECATDLFGCAVMRAGCAYSVTVGGKYEMLRNVMNVSVKKYEEQYRLLLVSTDGLIASGAYVPISKQRGLEALKEGELSLSLNASVFTKIASAISGEAVTLYLVEKQVIMQDGYDIYIIVPNATVFPVTVGSMLLADIPKGYEFSVSKKRLLSAMDVALLSVDSGDAGREAVAMTVEDGALTISSRDGGCRSKLDAENITGAVRIGANATYVRKLLAPMGSVVQIYGSNAAAPIYFSDEMQGARCFLAPVQLDQEAPVSNEAKSE